MGGGFGAMEENILPVLSTFSVHRKVFLVLGLLNFVLLTVIIVRDLILLVCPIEQASDLRSKKY